MPGVGAGVAPGVGRASATAVADGVGGTDEAGTPLHAAVARAMTTAMPTGMRFTCSW